MIIDGVYLNQICFAVEGERGTGRRNGERERWDGERERWDGERERWDGERERWDGERERWDGERERWDGERERWDGEREREQKSDSLASGYIDSFIGSYDAIPREITMATLRWMGVPEGEVSMAEGTSRTRKAWCCVGRECQESSK